MNQREEDGLVEILLKRIKGNNLTKHFDEYNNSFYFHNIVIIRFHNY